MSKLLRAQEQNPYLSKMRHRRLRLCRYLNAMSSLHRHAQELVTCPEAVTIDKGADSKQNEL
jgi:hypothetical protein